MKIRSGFVSNSSSSSYVIITPNDYEYLSNIKDENHRKIIDEIIDYDEDKFMNNDIKIYNIWQDDSCGEGTFQSREILEQYYSEENRWEEGGKLFHIFLQAFDKDKCLIVYTGD